MITFDLECDNGHRFEGWFKNREDFDGQLTSSAIACPLCESVKIRKLPSKAAVHVQKNSLPQNLQSKVEALSYYRALGDFVEKNFEYVGEGFAEEAKKRIRVHDLMDTFDRVQKRELFDETVASLLYEQYR